ncbi:helix-turn-helix domain-containing protein [Nocardia gipuzkoensis]|uniref:helix-turn-helix domain-containing protein n=1 Tax=Nocardia gipuzkoensis TaxID=2749991 RepID=UPI00237EBA0D|nr:helix-turn-helix transcriptional regulator [Nocardia gipuzkoensis]MDE1673738.1 helix-turn-helix transcriptional regulator [Nocardia gipuzkoensis]
MDDEQRDSLLSVATAALAETLRAQRARRRLLQKDVAERAGISLTTIKRYESAETAPDVAQLMALCRALDISTQAFLDAAEKAADEKLASRNATTESVRE